MRFGVDFILLLLLEVRDHLVHGFLHLCETIKLHGHRQCCELGLWAARGTEGRRCTAMPCREQITNLEIRLPGSVPQSRRCARAPHPNLSIGHGVSMRGHLKKTHCLGRELSRIIILEDCKSFCNCLHLLRARGAPLLPILVKGLALEPEIGQELYICRPLLAGQLKILLRVREGHVVIGMFALQAVQLLFRNSDCCCFALVEFFIVRPGLQFILLRLAQIGLKLVLHL
mmetsp:Transcript_11540/g.24255  ORF Transcript_11540/g.24255 Transcript_11540/m.24255 type:complete len:229 (-) Transcript_11540:1089-1775(-)